MKSSDDIYVSFNPEIYRRAKSNGLHSQAELLIILKRFHNLKVLSRQRNDLKRRLHQLTSSIVLEVDRLKDKLPKPKVPKGIHNPEKKIPKTKIEVSARNHIEEELREIQEKLRELNN